jgi:hypothetical protein
LRNALRSGDLWVVGSRQFQYFPNEWIRPVMTEPILVYAFRY